MRGIASDGLDALKAEIGVKEIASLIERTSAFLHSVGFSARCLSGS
jgi:hypothetical protein